jgi:hypothetical protein
MVLAKKLLAGAGFAGQSWILNACKIGWILRGFKSKIVKDGNF